MDAPDGARGVPGASDPATKIEEAVTAMPLTCTIGSTIYTARTFRDLGKSLCLIIRLLYPRIEP